MLVFIPLVLCKVVFVDDLGLQNKHHHSKPHTKPSHTEPSNKNDEDAESSDIKEELKKINREKKRKEEAERDTDMSIMNNKSLIENLVFRKDEVKKALKKIEAERRIIINEIVKMNKEIEDKKSKLDTLNEDAQLQESRIVKIELELKTKADEAESKEKRKEKLSKEISILKNRKERLEELENKGDLHHNHHHDSEERN